MPQVWPKKKKKKKKNLPSLGSLPLAQLFGNQPFRLLPRTEAAPGSKALPGWATDGPGLEHDNLIGHLTTTAINRAVCLFQA